MVQNDELYIVLGCFGRRDDNFVSCLGCENRILLLKPVLEGYDEIMEYFEGCRLFDKPMFDINGIRNFIFHMQNKFDQGLKRLWSEKQFTLYQKFILEHRFCGTYIKLILVSIENDLLLSDESEKIFIKATDNKNLLAKVRRIK